MSQKDSGINVLSNTTVKEEVLIIAVTVPIRLFVIPKYKISDDELYDLLEIAYRID